jgi:peptide/nickel transport system permease protein
MGNLLLESYFGIPGLGDLMITSINDRNEPIMNGLVFLTGLIWTVGVLVTDICYAIFDPRIRLQ